MAQPLDNLTRTWAIGATESGIKLSVTDPGAAAGSNLLELRGGAAGTTPRFRVKKDGTILFTEQSSLIPNGNSLEFWSVGSAYKYWAVNYSAQAVDVYRGFKLRIESDAVDNTYAVLAADAGNTLAQRNGTNAQTTRVYSTYTAADNFQRLAITSASATLSALSGASVTATALIPAGAVVVGVTTRVGTLITGATGYQVGTAADPDRWGDITGTAVGTTSDNANWTAGTIECFTAATNVIITAKTSNFTAGALTVTVHYLAGQAD